VCREGQEELQFFSPPTLASTSKMELVVSKLPLHRPNRKWEKLWLRCAFDSLLLVVVTAPALPIAQYSDGSPNSILETALILHALGKTHGERSPA